MLVHILRIADTKKRRFQTCYKCSLLLGFEEHPQNKNMIPMKRKASLATIEFLLLCGCEVTAQVLADGFGFIWFLPDGFRCEPVSDIQDLPQEIDDYLADCFTGDDDE
jgi:hypothetical protein